MKVTKDNMVTIITSLTIRRVISVALDLVLKYRAGIVITRTRQHRLIQSQFLGSLR